jgi:hypothetical protein
VPATAGMASAQFAWTERGFAMTRNGANLGFNFTSATGRTYTLWQSDTLAPGSWTNTGQPAIAGDGTAKSFTLPTPNNTIPKRFYRVQVQ